MSFKARIVARGDMQRKGIDYDETFSLTVRAATVRIFMALVALLGWTHLLKQGDVPAAFLQAIAIQLQWRPFKIHGYKKCRV